LTNEINFGENENLQEEEDPMPIFHRRLPKLRYVSPLTIEEAFQFLADHKGEAGLMAGGTDLIPNIKRREIPSPAYVVDLKSCSNLKDISYDPEQGLRIGALATIRSISEYQPVRRLYPSLVQAALGMASPQIRNRGTFVGNICSAIPSADSAPPLLTFGAKAHLCGPDGERVVPLDQFFRNPRVTAVKPDEIVTALTLPKPLSRSVYLKLSPRHSMDLAIVGVAAAADQDRGSCSDIRVALGAVAPVPMRAKKTEEILRSGRITSSLIQEAAHAASLECRPIDDYRASAEYRRDMVAILARRALEQVLIV
jgi:carbon-monoxide dehydrogenase medium subunit